MPLGKTMWRKEIGETNGKRNFFREVLEMHYWPHFAFLGNGMTMAVSSRKRWYGVLDWNMQNKWYGKSRNCISFVRVACKQQKRHFSSCRTTETENVGYAIVFCRLDYARKMELRNMAIKVSRCQHGKKKKSP